MLGHGDLFSVRHCTVGSRGFTVGQHVQSPLAANLWIRGKRQVYAISALAQLNWWCGGRVAITQVVQSDCSV